MRASTEGTECVHPKREEIGCAAKSVYVQGKAEPSYICPYCGDVTDEPRCPQDTPRQARDGTDI